MTRTARPSTILFIVCLAQFILLIDDTIVNVALPSIARDFDLKESALSWVPNAYLLMFGGFLLVGGRLADLLGRRRVLVVSMTVFVAASAACGAASGDLTLIIARGVQGLAGAFMSPAAFSILLSTYREDKARSRALAVWGALTAVGAMTGILLGGVLVDLISWHWIFWINLPVGLVTIVAALRLVPIGEPHELTRAPGLLSAVLGTGALLSGVYTVVEANDRGWTSAATFIGFGVAAALALGFVLAERGTASPLMPSSVVRPPNVWLGNAFMIIAAGAMIAMFFFVTLFMQLIWGYSPLHAGVSWLPFSLTLALVGGITSVLVERVNAILFLAAGATVAAVGMIMVSRVGIDDSYASALLPAIICIGAGFGLAFVPLLGVATKGVSAHESGIASGLLTSSQQIGGAVGIAALVSIASSVTSSRLNEGIDGHQALAAGFTSALSTGAMLLLAAAVIGLVIAVVSPHSGRLAATEPTT